MIQVETFPQPSIQSIHDLALRETSLENIALEELTTWESRIVCVSGPSGAGKHSFCRALLAMMPEVFLLVGPCTTRPCTEEDISAHAYKQLTVSQYQTKRSNNEFLLWRHTTHGLYGIEKDAIRHAMVGRRLILLTFRSLGCVALKYIMPRLLVINLVVTKSVVNQRLQRRARMDDNIEDRMNAMAFDSYVNLTMANYWKGRPEKNWITLWNNEDVPPISPNVVNAAVTELKARHII